MTRRILIVAGVAVLAVLGFALILAVGYTTLHLVLGDAPYTLESRIHAMLGTILALFALVAVIAAGCTASVLSSRHVKENDQHAVRR